MSAPRDVVRAHEFDGITEFDNRLPNWWLWTFYLACIFSFFYWLHFHVLKTGMLPRERFAAEMAEYEARRNEIAVSDEMLLAKAQDPEVLASGAAVFQGTCLPCHGPRANGVNVVDGQSILLPGPNLTDRFWLHGGRPVDIYRTISQGVPNTAMIAWKGVLGANKCVDVTAYVLSLRNTDVPGGKEPEGTEYVEEGGR